METKFNFKSAICTSREQSERLLALGLKKETADMCWMYGEVLSCNPPELTVDIPAWSLHRLLCIVKECWNVKESLIIDTDNIYPSAIKRIEWLIKEGYFNKEYLNEDI